MITQKLEKFARPLVESLGFDYWGAEYLSGDALLRVFIDAESGISVDDCAAVSRELSVMLDVEDIVASKYRLEISSPGMKRQFFELQQFQGFLGHQLKVRLRSSFEGRKNFKGVLSSVDLEANELGIIIEEEEYLLPYEQVEKANLVPDFDQ